MLYGLLLAGGKSSRMGEDKSQLLFQGKSLLVHALDLLSASGTDRNLISGQVDGHDFIPDLNPHSGPPGGIHSAISSLSNEANFKDSLLLVIPVDMPFLTSEAIARLVEGIGDQHACRYENEIFPCVFRLSSSLLKHLENIFTESQKKGGDRSMRALLDFSNALSMSKDGLPEKTFGNINTPADRALLN